MLLAGDAVIVWSKGINTEAMDYAVRGFLEVSMAISVIFLISRLQATSVRHSKERFSMAYSFLKGINLN